MQQIELPEGYLQTMRMLGSLCMSYSKGEEWVNDPAWYYKNEKGEVFSITEDELPLIMVPDLLYAMLPMVEKLKKRIEDEKDTLKEIWNRAEANRSDRPEHYTEEAE